MIRQPVSETGHLLLWVRLIFHAPRHLSQRKCFQPEKSVVCYEKVLGRHPKTPSNFTLGSYELAYQILTLQILVDGPRNGRRSIGFQSLLAIPRHRTSHQPFQKSRSLFRETASQCRIYLLLVSGLGFPLSESPERHRKLDHQHPPRYRLADHSQLRYVIGRQDAFLTRCDVFGPERQLVAAAQQLDRVAVESVVLVGLTERPDTAANPLLHLRSRSRAAPADYDVRVHDSEKISQQSLEGSHDDVLAVASCPMARILEIILKKDCSESSISSISSAVSQKDRLESSISSIQLSSVTKGPFQILYILYYVILNGVIKDCSESSVSSISSAVPQKDRLESSISSTLLGFRLFIKDNRDSHRSL